MKEQIVPQKLDDLLAYLHKKQTKHLFYAGGSDLMVLQNRKRLPALPLVHLHKLAFDMDFIKVENEVVEIGALTTFSSLISSKKICQNLPFLGFAMKEFASPILQTFATIGGNIANGSPTADSIPVLQALNAVLVLRAQNSTREIALNNFFTGYKQNVLQDDELIFAIKIPLIENEFFEFKYKKVGARKSLSIAKLNVVVGHHINDYSNVRIALGALNEYPRRFYSLEKKIAEQKTISEQEIETFLKQEITPITDFRSDKEYRFEVAKNILVRYFKEIKIYKEA